MSAAPNDPYGFCETVVRDGDRDAWLAALFAPAALRPSLHALDAFRIETGHVRSRVSQPLAGEIRLQWWRDAVFDEARGDAAANPLAAALIDTIRRHELPHDLFDAAIDAHRDELHEPAPATMAALEARLEAKVGTFFRLAGRVLAGPPGDAVDAARHAGIALGLCRLLQSFAEDAPRGWSPLPAELLSRHEVEPADIAAGRLGAGLNSSLSELAGIAHQHLSAFAATRRTIPPAIEPAFLRLSPIAADLERAKRQVRRDPFSPPGPLPQWRRQWLIWRMARSSSGA